MKIFIGSSNEQLPVINEIVKELGDIMTKYDLYIESWKEWFDHGQFNNWSTWRVIQQALIEFDMAIMLLAADDIVYSRDEERKMTRDNVLLEAGAFAQKSGIENVILLTPKGEDYKTPSDLLGLNCIPFDYARGANNAEAYRKIREKIHSLFDEEATNDERKDSNIKIKIVNEKSRKPRGKIF